MEKDFNFTFPGNDGSSTSNVPHPFFQRQQSSSSRSLDSSYSNAMATGCQGDTRNAVADSRKTKAVIASRRNDFFSDMMTPLISRANSSVCVSTASFPATSVNIPSATVSNYSMRASDLLSVTSIPIVSRSIPSITVNVSSTDLNIPLTSSNVNIPSTAVNVPLATVNQPLSTVNVPSTNVSSGTVNSTVPSLNSMNIPVVSQQISLSTSNSSDLFDRSLKSSPSTIGSAFPLHAAGSRIVPTGSDSKTGVIPTSSATSEKCHVSDFSVKPTCAVPCSSSLKLDAEKQLASGLSFEASKLLSEPPHSVQTNRANIVDATNLKIGFEKADHSGKTDDAAAFSFLSSTLNSGKADGVKTGINNIPHITGLNDGQQAYQSGEWIQSAVQVMEPVCFDVTPCGSVLLEPSPERIWGPQVSFLTFSCLDISRREVVGQMRQVSSTGCLEALGSSGHRQDDGSEATKLMPSNGEFGSSSQSVSDSEKSAKVGRSPNDDLKSGSVSNSFQDFDWNRMTVDASLRIKKTSTASGWFHSPSTRRKRDPTAERDAVHVTKVKETWKGRMARTFRRVGSASTLSPAERTVAVRTKGTFDVPIELCVPSTDIEGLPQIVEICTRVIEERGIENQGIYRVPGNNGFVRQMVEDLNEDANGLCAGNERWRDVNVVSSLLKLFFRRLPDPLITYKLYQPVIDASRIVDIDARLLRLRDVLHDLPPVNFCTFQFLAKHLHRVADHEQVNKMDAHNLAIIFGPTLIRPRDNNMVAVINDMNDQCRVVESVILHYDWFFGISEELEVPRSEGSKESTPVSSMSEELLAKAHQLGDFDSPSSTAIDRISTVDKEKFRWGRDPKHSNDSGMAMADTPTIVAEEAQSSIHEIVFAIKRYPAYHFKDSGLFCTENAKPKVRRTHSNESLGQSRTGTPPFASRKNRSTVKGSMAIPLNSSCGQLTE